MSQSPPKNFFVIGLMSGTSLDGLDIAFCEFVYDKRWKFRIIRAETISYDKVWKYKLSTADQLSARELMLLDREFASFCAQAVKSFIKKDDPEVELIASHGHTVFHMPEQGMTCQIGNGETLAALLEIAVVSDFRSADVALGGQGAPLVPMGDHLLFSEFDACLNLGGIANISFMKKGTRVAFDICPVNLVFNYLAQKMGQEYDDRGKIASDHKVDLQLKETLNSLPFYSRKPPKSLGKEWLDEKFIPLLNEDLGTGVLMATSARHISEMILRSIPPKCTSILVTGGGVFNTNLMKLLNESSPGIWKIPQSELIAYKEAAVFAFLGVLRIVGVPNVMASVTAASRDHSAGSIHGPA